MSLEPQEHDADEPVEPQGEPSGFASARPSELGGFAPPPGPLPRRYGPRPTVTLLRRAVLAVIVASGLLGPAENLLEVLNVDPLVAFFTVLAVLVAGWVLYGAARRWQRRRSDRPREITASAVLFTHRGLRIYTGAFSSEQIGWGELAGLVRDGGEWQLEARPGDRPVRIRFPAGRDWAERLLDALRDRPAPATQPPDPEEF